jgi:hypothetical protein
MKSDDALLRLFKVDFSGFFKLVCSRRDEGRRSRSKGPSSQLLLLVECHHFHKFVASDCEQWWEEAQGFGCVVQTAVGTLRPVCAQSVADKSLVALGISRRHECVHKSQCCDRLELGSVEWFGRPQQNVRIRVQRFLGVDSPQPDVSDICAGTYILPSSGSGHGSSSAWTRPALTTKRTTNRQTYSCRYRGAKRCSAYSYNSCTVLLCSLFLFSGFDQV